jgi:WD40 repeat protein
MRYSPWLALVLIVPVCLRAAPRTEDLPPGAIARLAPAVEASKGADSPPPTNALVFIDEQSLFVGTDGGWQTWDIKRKQPRRDRPTGGRVHVVARDSSRLFVGSAHKIQAFEPIQSSQAEPARSWESASELVNVLAVGPRGQRLVCTDGELRLAVIDAVSGKKTGVAEFSSQPVAAALTANGRVLAVVTRDGAARVYALAANGSLQSLWSKRVARSERGAAQFSPDGRLFAVSSAGRVLLLDAITGRPLQVLERRFGEGDVRCLTFSPDSRQVAAGTNGPEGIVRIADIATGAEQATFKAHAGDVNAVAFSSDGRTLASAGADSVIWLWKVPVPSPGPKLATAAEAWETLDSLDADVAYRTMGALLANRGRAVAVIGDGFNGIAEEQKKIRRWIAELDHDEFRVRELARRSILKTGLRGASALTDPSRKKLGVEGETRVRLILEALESQGLRIPESGLFGEPLRTIRGIRVLELIGDPSSRGLLEEVAKGPAESRLTKEAIAALSVFPTEK